MCAVPLVFDMTCIACMRSWYALTITSAGVTVGCVMYLCLKNTVSEILVHQVALTKTT